MLDGMPFSFRPPCISALQAISPYYLVYSPFGRRALFKLLSYSTAFVIPPLDQIHIIDGRIAGAPR